ncbi:MAG TPA: hypothetical protein VK655_03120 [Solirubrobacteraceae bacterium]|nr:hypothetical protein [Solirubrobacteraceae bacterium]
MRGIEFGLELGLLALEQARRDGLLGEAHLDQLVLTGFELAYQGGLGPPDLAHGILADRYERADRRLAACHARGRHLHRGIVALDQLLKQLRPNVGSARAGRAVDPAATEEVGVLAAVASR